MPHIRETGWLADASMHDHHDATGRDEFLDDRPAGKPGPTEDDHSHGCLAFTAPASRLSAVQAAADMAGCSIRYCRLCWHERAAGIGIHGLTPQTSEHFKVVLQCGDDVRLPSARSDRACAITPDIFSRTPSTVPVAPSLPVSAIMVAAARAE